METSSFVLPIENRKKEYVSHHFILHKQRTFYCCFSHFCPVAFLLAHPVLNFMLCAPPVIFSNLLPVVLPLLYKYFMHWSV